MLSPVQDNFNLILHTRKSNADWSRKPHGWESASQDDKYMEYWPGGQRRLPLLTRSVKWRSGGRPTGKVWENHVIWTKKFGFHNLNSLVMVLLRIQWSSGWAKWEKYYTGLVLSKPSFLTVAMFRCFWQDMFLYYYTITCEKWGGNGTPRLILLTPRGESQRAEWIACAGETMHAANLSKIHVTAWQHVQ